jgi:transposase-like protein
MEPITTELVESDRGYDKRGRRLVAAEERARLVAAYAQSGLTQAAFARREGIKYTTFCSWLQQQRQRGGPAKSPLPKVRFAEVQLPANAAAVEVRLADGTVVRGASGREVAAVVRALRT